MKYIKREIKTISSEDVENLKRKYAYKEYNYTYWKYDYEEYNPKNHYSLETFLEQEPTKRNYNSYNNFETVYRFNNKDFFLHLPILACQALGTNEAVLLVEYARLSQNLPINKFGFFLTSSNEIKKDTGLTYTQQATANRNLEAWKFIFAKTFRNPINMRFVMFNDNFAKHEYLNWKSQRGKFNFDIGRQYNRIKKKKKSI